MSELNQLIAVTTPRTSGLLIVVWLAAPSVMANEHPSDEAASQPTSASEPHDDSNRYTVAGAIPLSKGVALHGGMRMDSLTGETPGAHLGALIALFGSTDLSVGGSVGLRRQRPIVRADAAFRGCFCSSDLPKALVFKAGVAYQPNDTDLYDGEAVTVQGSLAFMLSKAIHAGARPKVIWMQVSKWKPP